jgi:polypyrimidine tract-binding protein 2
MTTPYPTFPSSTTPSATSPSKVVHLRNVTQDLAQTDLEAALQSFGSIAGVLILKGKNQALVEFEDINDAMKLMNHCSKMSLRVGSTQVYPQYSNHPRLNIGVSTGAKNAPANRILLVTIEKVYYQITIDILSSIFSPYETHPRRSVEKIVIVQKPFGLQALIQYSSVECANNAKNSLDGKNIYSNSCILHIQFSNLTDVTVKYNTDSSRDFTDPHLPTVKPGVPSSPSLLGDRGTARGTMPSTAAPGSTDAAFSSHGGEHCVVLVSGFPPNKVGPDQLFNLFSNYGEIIRIRVLHAKPNTALIQFAEAPQAQQALVMLKGIRAFGSSLLCSFSKYPSITPIRAMSSIETSTSRTPDRASVAMTTDGKAAEYGGSRLNRFGTRGVANLRNLTGPTDVLHVSNLSTGIPSAGSESKIGADATTAARLRSHIEKVMGASGGMGVVTEAKVFEKNGKYMGLVQFSSPEAAVEAMMIAHNTTLDGKSIRLAFTRSQL